MPNDARTALPLLECISRIAHRYECLQIVRSAFKSLASDWITGKTLYAAVAAEPARWLVLAIELRHELVYSEAFVHLAGQGLNNVGPVDYISEDVKASIVDATQTLMLERAKIDQQLTGTTLSRTKRLSDGTSVSAVVSQNHCPVVYSTVNLWRDWIGEHMSNLLDSSSDLAATSSELCDHSCTESHLNCLTVAGIYRILHCAGEAFMPSDQIIANWNHAFGKDMDTVRSNLNVLKARARMIVAPMVRSSLQLEERNELPYLTCVKVGKVPWAGNGEDDEDEEDADNGY